MAYFHFLADKREEAIETLEKIKAKFENNEQAKKLVFAEFKEIKPALFSCEFIFPFPDLRAVSWWFFLITTIIVLFTGWWLLLIGQGVLFFSAYVTQYLLSPSFLFKMLQKGLAKNGYTGTIRRLY